jgi:hypothetical protein
MHHETRLFLGFSLLSVPTVVYGGLTLLGVVTGGVAGLPGPPELTPVQVALYRAGHAHAGVLLLLSLLLQMAIEHATLSSGVRLAVRVAAPAAAVVLSAGFFGLAHLPALKLLLYAGALLVVFATVATGIGLVRRPVASKA